MAFLTATRNKWAWAAVIVLSSLVILAAFSKKSVKTEIVIPVDADVVWSVLMDGNNYNQWNPVLTPQSDSFQIGETISYHWNLPGGESIEVEAKIVELVERELLHQRGGTVGLLTFNHRYQLYSEETGTRVVQSEAYRGIGVWFWDAHQMGLEYQKVNQALREHVIDSR